MFERITYACKYSNAKIIVHSHSTGYAKGYYKTKVLHALGKLFVKRKSFYKIACGEEAGKFMFGKEKFKIINNGIDIQHFKYSDQARNKIRKELDIPSNTTVISHVGVFYPVKNHKFLVEVFCEYVKLSANSKLILVGDGENREKLDSLVNKYHLEDNFYLVGSDINPYRWIRMADIYVQPSRFEGFGITVAEAKLLDKMIVASNIPEFRFQLEGEKGIIANDIEDFYQKIKELINNPEISKKYTNKLKYECSDNDEFKKIIELIEQ